MNPKRYYIQDGKVKSTTNKVTSRFIYEKKAVYTNNIGSTYKTKKLAIKAYLKLLSRDIKDAIERFNEHVAIINKQIRKFEKELRK